MISFELFYIRVRYGWAIHYESKGGSERINKSIFEGKLSTQGKDFREMKIYLL